MTKKHSMLKPAALRWQQATPVSASFDDFYFSTDNGLDESRYVFLDANQVLGGLVDGPLNEPFIIAETGFGTGLNFLATWQAWRELEQAKRPLHFFSIEKYPLAKNDLAHALLNWPELSAYAQALASDYPPLVKGLHTLDFDQGKVRLSLFFGDVNELSHHIFQADVWYLDGFSPQKNPDMWSASLFEEISRHSKTGTRFSTFTAASDIRKRLQLAGFTVKKRVGFGVKREMIYGNYLSENAPARQEDPHLNTQGRVQNLWSQPAPKQEATNISILLKEGLRQKDTHEVYDAAIVGAGLAGLATAYELVTQGLKVCLIDANAAPVQGASGQSQLAMYAKLPSEANKLFHFIIYSLSDSIRYYTKLQAELSQHTNQSFWHPTGLMQLAWNDKERRKQESFLNNICLPEDLVCPIDSQTASIKSGLNIECAALWFEQAGWLNPTCYAQTLLHSLQSDPRFRCYFNYTVECLDYQAETQLWSLRGQHTAENIYARSLVIANANSAKRFPQCAHLPTKPLRGQVTSIKHASLIASKTVVCGEGYLCPAHQQWHHFGATFDLKNQEALIKDSDAQQNIQSLQNWLPGWLNDATVNSAEFQHSAGLRCTTPDYLPIVGPAPRAEEMIDSFARLRVDSNACNAQYGHYYPNLYVNIGHGSKGLFTTPLAAKIIRQYICGGLPACSEEHRVMLSPARFLIKHLCQRRL